MIASVSEGPVWQQFRFREACFDSFRRTRSDRWMFWKPVSTFFFVVLKTLEGANPAVGCYRGPDLAAFLF